MVDATVAQERREFYVYVIFRPNGVPCYVGKGRGSRLSHHKKRAYNPHLRRIYAQAGGDLPAVIVRGGLTDPEAIETEIAFIAAIGRERNGGPLVNMTDGGDGISGFKFSAESIEKIRKATVGRKYGPLSEEAKEKIAASRRGKKRPPTVIEALRQANLGRKCAPFTQEHRDKIAAALRGRTRPASVGEAVRASRLGKKASEESRRAMSASRTGKPLSAAHRESLSRAQRNTPRTEVQNDSLHRMHQGNVGRHHSDETRAKMRAAHALRLAAERVVHGRIRDEHD